MALLLSVFCPEPDYLPSYLPKIKYIESGLLYKTYHPDVLTSISMYYEALLCDPKKIKKENNEKKLIYALSIIEHDPIGNHPNQLHRLLKDTDQSAHYKIEGVTSLLQATAKHSSPYKELLVTEHYIPALRKTQEVCPITFNRFTDEKDITILPLCGHAFSAQGLSVWLKNHDSCPICRKHTTYY